MPVSCLSIEGAEWITLFKYQGGKFSASLLKSGLESTAALLPAGIRQLDSILAGREKNHKYY